MDAVNGLTALVVVAEHDLLLLGALGGRLDLLEQLGLGRAGLSEELGALGGQRAQATGDVLVAIELDLVQQLREDNG